MFFANQLRENIVTLIGIILFLFVVTRIIKWKWFKFFCKVRVDLVFLKLVLTFCLITIPLTLKLRVFAGLIILYILLFYIYLGTSIGSIVYRQKTKKRKKKKLRTPFYKKAISIGIFCTYIRLTMLMGAGNFLNTKKLYTIQEPKVFITPQQNFLVQYQQKIQIFIKDTNQDQKYDLIAYDIDFDDKIDVSYQLQDNKFKTQLYNYQREQQNILIINIVAILFSLRIISGRKKTKKSLSMILLGIFLRQIPSNYILAQNTHQTAEEKISFAQELGKISERLLQNMYTSTAFDNNIYILSQSQELLQYIAQKVENNPHILREEDILDDTLQESENKIQVIEKTSSQIDEVAKHLGIVGDIIGTFNDYNEYSEIFGDNETAIKEATSISLITATILCSNPVSLLIDFVALIFQTVGYDEAYQKVYTFSIDRIYQEILKESYHTDFFTMKKNLQQIQKAHRQDTKRTLRDDQKIKKIIISSMVTISAATLLSAKRSVEQTEHLNQKAKEKTIVYLYKFVTGTQKIFAHATQNRR